MHSIFDQIKPEAAESIAVEVEARDLTVEGYLKSPQARPNGLDLRSSGIQEVDAADRRARLTTLAEDWSRPEADIYDEDPPR